MKKVAVIGMSVAMLLGAMAGCSPSGSSPGESENKTVKLGYVNWSEGIAMTNLAAVVLEDKMGYKAELTMADTAPISTSMASGNTDVSMDVWPPITHRDYMKEYDDRVDDLSACYENAMIGFTVPSYVPVNSIEELNANKELFGGGIIGIDSSSATMKTTYKLTGDYALDCKLLPGNGPTMTAALKKAVDANKPTIVVGWEPYWKFARWGSEVLEDSKKIYGTSKSIHIVSGKGLSEDMSEVVDFLKNSKMNEQEIGDLMGVIEEKGGDLPDVAREWAKEHQNLIKDWTPVK